MPAVPGPAFGGVAPSPAGAARVVNVRARPPRTQEAHPSGRGIAGIRGARQLRIIGGRGATTAPFPAMPRLAGTCGQDARGPGPRLRRGCASPGGRRAGRQRAGETPAHPRSARGRHCGALRGSAGLGAVETPAVPGSARRPQTRRRRGPPGCAGVSPARLDSSDRWREGRNDCALPGNAAPCGNVRAGCPRSRAPPSAGLRLPRRAPRGAATCGRDPRAPRKRARAGGAPRGALRGSAGLDSSESLAGGA